MTIYHEGKLSLVRYITNYICITKIIYHLSDIARTWHSKYEMCQYHSTIVAFMCSQQTGEKNLIISIEPVEIDRASRESRLQISILLQRP